MTYHLDGQVMKELHFLCAESLSWSDNYRFTCVDSKRVEILHVTDCDAVVITVTHHLVFDFLPAF